VALALLTGTFLASLEVMVVAPAMPRVVAEFGDAGLYPWVFITFLIASTVTIPLYGFLADRWGRRASYLLAVALFLGGSLVCAFAGSMIVVVAGRTIQGFGAGGLMPLTLTLFGDLYAVEDRTKMQGVFSLIWGVSSLLGPLAGGFLTETLSWRAIFWINVVPGLPAAMIVVRTIPGGFGRGFERTQGGLLTLLTSRMQLALNSSGLFIGATMMGIISFLPVWVQAVEGGTPLDAGLALVPLSLAWTLGTNLNGRLVSRLGFLRMARWGTVLTAAGAILAAVTTAERVALAIYGLGMGIAMSTFVVAAQEAAPEHQKGAATSYPMFFRTIGAAVGVYVFGRLAGLQPGVGSFAAVVGLARGVSGAFWASALSVSVGAVVLFMLFPRPTDPTRSPGRSPTQ
jgi:MFS family permease